jgi:hypothetical protein
VEGEEGAVEGEEDVFSVANFKDEDFVEGGTEGEEGDCCVAY